LYLDGAIAYEEALIASDSPTNLAWLVNQNTPTARTDQTQGGEDTAHVLSANFAKLEIDPEFLNRDR
jgi:hypothetical protein